MPLCNDTSEKVIMPLCNDRSEKVIMSLCNDTSENIILPLSNDTSEKVTSKEWRNSSLLVCATRARYIEYWKFTVAVLHCGDGT